MRRDLPVSLVPVLARVGVLCVLCVLHTYAAPRSAAAQVATDVPSAPGIGARGMPPSRVVHAPLSDVSTGTVMLTVAVEDVSRMGTLVVRWRCADGELHETPIERTERGLEARLSAVTAPTLAYWIVRLGDAGEEPVFASEASPHRVWVEEDAYARHLRVGHERVAGHLSQISLFGEWVDFGHRALPAESANVPDEFFHVSLGYAYSFYEIVERIRIEVGAFRGRGVTGEATDRTPGCMSSPLDCARDVGLYYGLAEVTWFLVDHLRLRTMLRLGFSQAGFDFGGGGEVVIGDRDAVELSVGFEGVTTLGVVAHVRLGWSAADIVPMGARVEATNFPSGADFGVRLVYDVGVVLYPGALVRGHIGYQSRTAVNGGVSAGGELVLAF